MLGFKGKQQLIIVTSFLAFIRKMLNKEKAMYFAPGFFFVDKMIKISNQRGLFRRRK